MTQRIAIHDADQTGYPNLALMKLSTWHKQQGASVEWFNPLFGPFDKVLSSKVFTYTKEDPYLPEEADKGGIGYDFFSNLPDDVEHIVPDYSLYELDHSMGFLTRGCPRRCKWCLVPEKEGAIRAHADIEEFAKHKDVVLMDNNVLAHSHGIEQLKKIARLGLKVDFNQGLDARYIDDAVARLLAAVKWLRPLRLACDHKGQMKIIRKTVELLRWHNVTPRNYFCYVLVKDVDDAVERVRFLKGMGVTPFAQPYRDRIGTEPTKKQRHFARWVNHKAVFNSSTWGEYRLAHAS